MWGDCRCRTARRPIRYTSGDCQGFPDGQRQGPQGRIWLVLALALYLFFGGYALFLLGFAVFMYFENQKFGDNQFIMKLLPPPGKAAAAASLETALPAAIQAESAPLSDWTAVPAPSRAIVRGERLSRAA